MTDALSDERADQLTGTILELEAERHSVDDRPMVADEALPGVGDASVSLREALQRGGKATFVTLGSLVAKEPSSTRMPRDVSRRILP